MFQVTGKAKQSHLGMRTWAPVAQSVGRASLKGPTQRRIAVTSLKNLAERPSAKKQV